MKILAISMGRKNHNCDIIAKQALMAAEKVGADVKFINTMNMEISHCRGCGACSASRDRGRQIRCILKDDYLALEQEILDADLYFIEQIGLKEHLSPTRSNGLLAMVKQIKMYALAFNETLKN